MSPLLLVPAAVLSLVYRASAADQGPISIFIDMVPEYRALETCAETELSTIVRNMAFGCGDDSRTTSYGCFCYESSAKFSSIIGKHVGTACADHYPQQNTSAIEVFSKYCDLGELTPANASTNAATTTAWSTASLTASPGSVSGSSTVTSTSSPTNSPSVSTSDRSPRRSNIIAVAVGVPLGVIAISVFIAIGFVYLRKDKATQSPPGGKESDEESQFPQLQHEPTEVEGLSFVPEVAGHPRCEAEGTLAFYELPSPESQGFCTAELPSSRLPTSFYDKPVDTPESPSGTSPSSGLSSPQVPPSYYDHKAHKP